MPDTGGPSIYLASLKLADPSGHFQLGAQVAARQQSMQLEARAQAFKETMSLFDMTNQAAQQIVKNRQIGVEQDQAQQRIDNGLVESQQRLEMSRQHQMAQEQYWKNGRGSSGTSQAATGAYGAYPTGTNAPAMPTNTATGDITAEDAANLQKNAEAFKARNGYEITDVEGLKQARDQGDPNFDQAQGMMKGYAAMQQDAQTRADKAVADSQATPANAPSNVLLGEKKGADSPEAGAANVANDSALNFGKPTPDQPWTNYHGPNGTILQKDAEWNAKTGQLEYAKRAMRDVTPKGGGASPPPEVPKDGEPPVKGMESGGVYHGNGIGTFEYDADNSHYVQQLKWNHTKGSMEPNGVPKKTRTQILKPGELPDPITNGDYTSYPIPTANGSFKWETHRGYMPPPDVPKEGGPPVAGMAPGDSYFNGGTGVSQFEIDGNKFYQMKKWEDKKGRMVPDGQPHKLPEPKPEPGKLPENITVGDSIGVAVPDSSGKWKYKFYQPEPDVAAKISAAKAQGFNIAGYTVSNGRVTVRAVAPKDPLTVAGAPEDLLAQIKGISGTPKNYIMQANATLYDASKYVNPTTGEAEPQPSIPDKLKALGRDPANPGTVTEEDWNNGYQMAMQARREQAAKTISNTIASLKGGVAKGAQWYLSHADAIINGSGATPMPTTPPATSAQPAQQQMAPARAAPMSSADKADALRKKYGL